jgi:hypothetical protein
MAAGSLVLEDTYAPTPAPLSRSGIAPANASQPYALNAHREKETVMGFGRGALLWLLGVPLPIIILLALFWH